MTELIVAENRLDCDSLAGRSTTETLSSASTKICIRFMTDIVLSPKEWKGDRMMVLSFMNSRNLRDFLVFRIKLCFILKGVIFVRDPNSTEKLTNPRDIESYYDWDRMLRTQFALGGKHMEPGQWSESYVFVPLDPSKIGLPAHTIEWRAIIGKKGTNIKIIVRGS